MWTFWQLMAMVRRALFVAKSHGKHVWQTEDSSQSPIYDGSMTDALSWASKIHTYLTVAQVNAWNWWFLSDGPKHGNGTDNSAFDGYKPNLSEACICNRAMEQVRATGFGTESGWAIRGRCRLLLSRMEERIIFDKPP